VRGCACCGRRAWCSRTSEASMKRAMKRALLVADVVNWAWGFRAADLSEYAPDGIEVTVAVQADVKQHDPRKYDAVYWMPWQFPDWRFLDRCHRKVTLLTCNGLQFDGIDDTNWQSWVYTQNRGSQRARENLPKFDAVIAVNQRLHEASKRHNRETYLVPSAVNTELFTPGPPAHGHKLKVGWCASPRGERSVKGHKEVLAPLVDRTFDKYDWVTNTRDYRDALTREQMVAWYHGIDVFVCTSINEGTPSPVFEAASCGRAVISTDVGCVADWKLPHSLDLVTGTYRNQKEAGAIIEATAARLAFFDGNRDIMHNVGQDLRKSVEAEYSYRTLAPRYYRAILGE